MIKIDPFALAQRIPSERLRLRALDRIMELFVPFSRGLGLRLESVRPTEVAVKSPDRKRRRNHVNTTHACALALLGEYPAGLIVAQNFPFDRYRFIISQLNIDYQKPGRGVLRAVAKANSAFPEAQDGELWVDLTTEIFDESNDLVAKCFTRWQVKEWQRTRQN